MVYYNITVNISIVFFGKVGGEYLASISNFPEQSKQLAFIAKKLLVEGASVKRSPN